jgi:hypothetical protein
MLKPIAAALLLAWQLAPSYPVQDYRNGPCKVTCQKEPVPSGFTCAILIGLDPPLPEGIASIVGGAMASFVAPPCWLAALCTRQCSIRR